MSILTRDKLFMFVEGAAVASSCALALRSWKSGERTWDTSLTLLATAALGLPFVALRLQHTTTALSTSRSSETEKETEPPVPTPSQLQHLIAGRRSQYPRAYSGKIVPKEQIQAMLEAANWAPTHGLTEPWRFVVLEGAGKAKFLDLTIEATEQLEPDEREKKLKKILGKKDTAWPLVSHYIAIKMKRQAKPPKLNPEWEEMCAVAAAVQNMLLTAAAHNVACYWTSWQPYALAYQPMRDFLELGEDDKCLGLIVVGHSEGSVLGKGSRKPVEEKVTWLS